MNQSQSYKLKCNTQLQKIANRGMANFAPFWRFFSNLIHILNRDYIKVQLANNKQFDGTY